MGSWVLRRVEIEKGCIDGDVGRCRERARRESQKHKVRVAQSITGFHLHSQERLSTTDMDGCNWVTRKSSLC